VAARLRLRGGLKLGDNIYYNGLNYLSFFPFIVLSAHTTFKLC
jgi:hypothetical protein